ncbi:hypothetical protein M441DRAFT_252663 [Trichoderma asperellum CBS 433.97]|uniref:Secreted protein n=1 Tax=Trichoderma asperellum (strain ATCC 204424 / CBS 433.97 / NBRC 101777) TaxID=1042311 RepID=A0A2T3YY41_TRIA4|nr:hypothetical protein M441DRAFT_252663 [Trichoderma asperellum CBS 433.97]PTB37485.1 hypothetical protein M441DRAFT_252663 [Trichoderma asperellum CBS 433.97]
MPKIRFVCIYLHRLQAIVAVVPPACSYGCGMGFEGVTRPPTARLHLAHALGAQKRRTPKDPRQRANEPGGTINSIWTGFAREKKEETGPLCRERGPGI